MSAEGGRRLLVVANETLTGDELIDAVRRRAQGDVLVRVIAPVNEPRAGYVVYDDPRSLLWVVGLLGLGVALYLALRLTAGNRRTGVPTGEGA